MFLKQYNYKPRTSSMSSTGSGSEQTNAQSPTTDANKATTQGTEQKQQGGTTGGVSAAIAGRRRVCQCLLTHIREIRNPHSMSDRALPKLAPYKTGFAHTPKEKGTKVSRERDSDPFFCVS